MLVAIPLIKPVPPLPKTWEKYLINSYQKNHFCNFGPAHQDLQSRIKSKLSLQHNPVLCCNATLALEVVLLAANLTECDILVPSFTFAATALAVERVNSRPILVDCNSFSWHLSLEAAEKRLTKNTKAMIVVHPLGMLTDPSSFIEFAEANKLILIFDSAAAFGANYPQDADLKTNPDKTGLCEVYSFHITKSLGIGEGATIVSGDSDFLEKCRRISNFGFSDLAEVEMLGTNAKMSDFQAAIGLAVLDTSNEVLRIRRDLASHYLEQLDDCWEALFQCEKEQLEQHTFSFFPIKYRGNTHKLIECLNANEVGFRQYYRPLHLHPHYATKKRNNPKHFPVCNELAKKVFCLPCHNAMTVEDVLFITSKIKELEN